MITPRSILSGPLVSVDNGVLRWDGVDGATIQGYTSNTPTISDTGVVAFSNGGSMTGTWTDLGSVTTIDINGGTIDGATIGGSVAGAGTFTALVATSLDLNGALDLDVAGLGATITNLTDGASVQVAIFEGDRATMVDNDEAYLTFRLSNDAGTQTEVARLTWVATDVNAATSVDGRLDFAVMTAGALADELQLDGTALSPSADGGLALGTTALGYSGVFLNTGAVINFEGGDVTWTHSAGRMTFSGELAGTNAASGLFSGEAAASATVPTFSPNKTDTNTGIGSAGAEQVSLIGGGYEIMRLTQGLAGVTAVTITQQAGTSGAPTALKIAGGAHTAITAATEDIGINFDFSATKTWAAGAGPLATQREFVFLAPTYNGDVAGALTMTNAATVYISGAPVQGTNITLSNTHALWVDAGNVRFDGTLNSTGGGALTGTWTDLGSVTTVDINGGTIDGATIGGAVAGAGTFTGLTINKATAGVALAANVTATTYTSNAAIIDIYRTGALTGVNTERIIDFNEAPAFTLTQPAAGSVTFIGANIDLADLLVTAGAGDSDIYAMRLFACSDADSKTNVALLVDQGKVTLNGGGTNRQISAGGGLLEMGASTIIGNNASGTLAIGAAVSLGVTTFQNGTATLTMTDVASLYIAGIPVASTNVTFTNTPWALWVDAGNVRFDGDVYLPTSGSKIDFGVGDVTLTYTANTLTLAGGNFKTGADADIDMGAGGRLFGGGIQANAQTLGANTNLTLDENDGVVTVTSGAVSANTITLPAASGNEGMLISVFLKTDGGLNANVVRAGADVIQNGSADLSNTQVALDDAGDFVMLQCVSSSEWQVLVNSGGAVT